MKKFYVLPVTRSIEIGSEEEVMQLITTSKGTETYDDDDDDDPATGPALVRRQDRNLWDEVW